MMHIGTNKSSKTDIGYVLSIDDNQLKRQRSKATTLNATDCPKHGKTICVDSYSHREVGIGRVSFQVKICQSNDDRNCSYLSSRMSWTMHPNFSKPSNTFDQLRVTCRRWSTEASGIRNGCIKWYVLLKTRENRAWWSPRLFAKLEVATCHL